MAQVIEKIETCEIGKLDAKLQSARKKMDRAEMEELMAKCVEWNHQSPSVDEVKRVLALPQNEREYIELEMVAGKETGDSERVQACRVKLWELDGNDAKAEKARKEMDRDGMEAMLAKAKEWNHFPAPVQEIQRVLALPANGREYISLEMQAGEEMGDKRRVRACKGKLFELDMAEVPSSFARWQSWGGLRDAESYAKGKWFGKAAVRDAFLCAEKAVVNNSITRVDGNPDFKKQAKDMSKGILSFCGIKPDPRGDQAIYESFLIAGRSPELKKELVAQVLKFTVGNPTKPVPGQDKAMDLLLALLYFGWCFDDEELFKYMVTYCKKSKPTAVAAAAHGKFDVAPGTAPRSASDLQKAINEASALGKDGGAVALT